MRRFHSEFVVFGKRTDKTRFPQMLFYGKPVEIEPVGILFILCDLAGIF